MIEMRIPQISVNDVEATLVEWLVSPGEAVTKGQVIARIETTKALIEVVAEADGYIWPLIEVGETVQVGKVFAVITETPTQPSKLPKDEEIDTSPEQGRQWTRKAELLAKRYGIRLEDIPAVGVIQEADVERFIQSGMRTAGLVKDLIDDVYTEGRAERVLVVGGGRGAVQVLDILWRCFRQRPVGIVDDNPDLEGKMIMGVPVLGRINAAIDLWEHKAYDAAVISFSNDIKRRFEVYEMLVNKGIRFTNVVDPSVHIHSNVSIGTGNVIIAGSRLGSCTTIGDNNFISAFCNIEHHNVVGSHCTFGPGVVTSSRVRIGDRIRFGTGIFIEPGVSIGSDSIIASGAVLGFDVPDGSIVKVRAEIVVRSREQKKEK